MKTCIRAEIIYNMCSIIIARVIFRVNKRKILKLMLILKKILAYLKLNNFFPIFFKI